MFVVCLNAECVCARSTPENECYFVECMHYFDCMMMMLTNGGGGGGGGGGGCDDDDEDDYMKDGSIDVNAVLLLISIA